MPCRGAEILPAREDFDRGSSRQHAPRALFDNGIRGVIAPSFADISQDDRFGNGILPVRLSRRAAVAPVKDAPRGVRARLTVERERHVAVRPSGPGPMPWFPPVGAPAPGPAR